jgi:hypothetical protein
MFFPDPNYSIPNPGSTRRISPKIGFLALGNMIRVVHPGSASLFEFKFYLVLDSEIKDTLILIAFFMF